MRGWVGWFMLTRNSDSWNGQRRGIAFVHVSVLKPAGYLTVPAGPPLR
jgi:hypothetical protein